MPALPPLYAITSTAGGRWDHLSCARALLDGGAKLIQVREKELPDSVLLRQLCAIRRECRRSGARLLVNDRVDLALAADCDGAHLGQLDLPVEAARRLLGPERLLGLSTHNAAQFEDAQRQPVDYVALGPIYRTTTKQDTEPPLGEEVVETLLSARRRPLVAIGGITLERARILWRLGVDTVAVIGDIVSAPDPAGRVRAYLSAAARG